MSKGTCPNCKSTVEVGKRPQIGQRLACPTCQTELEVIWLYPVELDYMEAPPNDPPKVGQLKTTEEDSHKL